MKFCNANLVFCVFFYFIFPFQQNKYVRAIMAVTLFCQTLIEPRGEGKQLNRDLISCKMTYTANSKAVLATSGLNTVVQPMGIEFIKETVRCVDGKVKH